MCGTRLRKTTWTEYYRNEKPLAERLGDFLLEADGSKLLERERSFEGLKYRALEKDGVPPVVVLLNEFIAQKTIRQYQRSSQALLIVQSDADRPYASIDPDGIGRLSMAYVLSAGDSDSARKACLESLEKLLADLRRGNAARVVQQALRSYQTLRSRSANYTDDHYETDIFNLLKFLFPETIRLGRPGKIEPDGFSAFPMPNRDSGFEAGILTWTYDAKLTASTLGYDLGIDECRKMVDYVNKFRRSKLLLRKSTRPRAHVLVSNRFRDAQLASVCTRVLGADGLDNEEKDLRLVFMTEEFLIRLYERVAEQQDQFRRLAPYFHRECAPLFEPPAGQRYRKLVASDADHLAEEVLGAPDVHPVIRDDELMRSLDK